MFTLCNPDTLIGLTQHYYKKVKVHHVHDLLSQHIKLLIIMDDEQETHNLWRIRKTIMQMCHDRGYLVTQDELDQTLDEFKSHFGDRPR